MKFDEMTLDVSQQIELKADIGDVFKSVLHRFGDGSTNPNGESMHMVLEQWPGGRWFRDRGNGIGHLRPRPSVRLRDAPARPAPRCHTRQGESSRNRHGWSGSPARTLRHRSIGLLEEAHRQNIGTGWKHYLDSIGKDFA